METIDATKTVFYLKSRKIQVGDFFSVIIQTKDKNNRSRVQGGDFWFPRIESDNLNASSHGKVVDFDNGTYEIIYFAAWEGKTTIDLTLVAPAEAIKNQKNLVWPIDHRIQWIGYFSDGKTNETADCGIYDRQTWKDMCEYPEPNALGGAIFLCSRPKTLPCDTLVSMNDSRTNWNDAYLKSEKGQKLWQLWRNLFYVQLLNGPRTVNIEPFEGHNGPNGDKKTDFEIFSVDKLNLPKCEPDQQRMLSDGYWMQSTWISFQCDTKQWSRSDIESCLRGKLETKSNKIDGLLFKKTPLPTYQDKKLELVQSSIQYPWKSLHPHVGTIETIDATKTAFYLKSRKIQVGDFFSVVIQTKDKNNRSRVQGGDFWFPRIESDNLNASSHGKVVDFDNGTYEIIYFAAWEGKTTIDLTLVAPAEAIKYQTNVVWPIDQRIQWIGYFSDGKTNETADCGIYDRQTWKDMCEYPEPNALGGAIFLCSRPKTLPCDTLVRFNESRANWNDAYLKTENGQKLWQLWRNLFYVQLLNGPHTVNIEPSKEHKDVNSDKKTDLEIFSVKKLNLPKCEPDQQQMLSDGYWMQSTWISFQCDTKQWSRSDIESCLRGKHVLLMGDSTTRQWYKGITKMLEFEQNWFVKADKIIRYYDHLQLNMTFRFHPYGMLPRISSFFDADFEANLLDKLPAERCNYIIVISPWAHYEKWTKDTYVIRLKFIVKAVMRLIERCPNSKIAVKSPHPREKSDFLLNVNYFFYEIRKLMRAVFTGVRVHFIDIWDMNNAYIMPNEMHMPMPVIYQELYMFFSHVC
ncbi:NXPE family member 1-like isoform X2 [Anneissia japonica]|nr:NXPE family member 1-like isoform X2 [Anneissia japonica]